MSESTRRAPEWLMPTIVLLVSLSLLGFVFLQQLKTIMSVDGSQNPGITNVSQPDMSHAEQRDPDDLLSAGPIDAPVVLVAFSDYQCPYCALWNEEILPEMMKYVESGDLRIEWREVNMYGESSKRAARAAHAAARQDRYLDFHNELFADGKKRPESQLTEEALAELATDLGLDADRLIRDMESPDVIQTTEEHEQHADDIGVSGTPTFIVGGQLIVGGQSVETFTDAVDEALSTAER